MKKALLIIDPQNDFIDCPNVQGSLAVPGAYNDMLRLASYIDNNNFDDVYVTLDTHSVLDIAHKSWWINEQGEHPGPFTIIGVEDINKGLWRAVEQNMQEHSLSYVQKLAENGKYQLCIWPDHCIKGTVGHQVSPIIASVLSHWEERTNKKVNYINKGENPMTEHYSGFKAEVVLDKQTDLNTHLLDTLNTYDCIEVSGEALSHCVAFSVRDLVTYTGKPEKINLLIDTMSSVPGFEKNGEQFIEDMQALGVQTKSCNIKHQLKIS